MSHKLTSLEMPSLLVDVAAIREYLKQVLSNDDDEELLRAIGYVAEACSNIRRDQTARVGSDSFSQT
ncbi:transcriptional regulator [Pseudomonas sp. 13B_3.2_Bac1]|uniref:transcriptional regulator n=1 Tax=Pseudomonas sp. 13B_3.2_Bac1 TaxID=2971623 RepID=UPI0021C8FD7D|nr:transcriptional regulator [Pseudomonas sp. 13B_3.2_Bac1]MCU1773944.1 transcriptional regulator [Pseudomonas sp. 13B_3.2_Bac1]